jgi:triacylglycerol lipase
MGVIRMKLRTISGRISFSSGKAQKDDVPARSDAAYIFVHGLSGWGSYDKAYKRMPYWGMFGGDLMQYLRRQGFACYAASVSPEGSAWDRACELYAQLTGTVTDYGKAHSERCGHARFGPDFSGRPLIPDWKSGKKLVLLGHSFGGATIRLFSQILASGDEAEQEASGADALSPFFLGGQGERLHALVTLAAPTNGTTAYDLYQDKSFDVSAVKVSRWDDFWGNFFSNRKQAEKDGRSLEDYAAFDMHIDKALALNARIATLPQVYYFAVPCSATQAADGAQRPIRSRMEPMFRRSSARMGIYTGVTAGGFVLDESWRENDGLVNTVSAMAPMGAPSKAFDPEAVTPGIWQILPTYPGDHMSLQGGMMKRNNIRPFYLELLDMIDTLPEG